MPRQSQAEGEVKRTRRLRRIQPWWTFGWLAILSLIYTFRLDATYAIFVWPAWLGAVLGIGSAVLSNRWRPWIFTCWALFAWLFVDEVASYPRLLLPAQTYDIRVVTLNCAGGTVAASEEVAAQNPDIVLFQETPSRPEIEKLSKKIFGEEGSCVVGPDAAIMARGHLVEEPGSRATNDFVSATWTGARGRSLRIVCLRLLPPCMRIDLFNPSAWQDFAMNRASRRQEVAGIAMKLDQQKFEPDLLGGDFNSPPDRDVLGPITNHLSDTFRQVGVGYGATCVNPFPCMVRIDQIWHSEVLNATRAWVVKTENSDHRMLVADFRWAIGLTR